MDYYCRNKSFLEAYEPKREATFYTYENQYATLQNEIELQNSNVAYRFYLFPKQEPEKMIGNIGITNIIWGCFLSCYMGYKLDEAYKNRGLMTEAVLAVTKYAFNELGLHRIEGNVMPHNKASMAVLKKCGFTEEGYSPQYLRINGIWQDHIHMVLINQE